MREIDLESWPRRKHFDLFCGMEFAHAGVCVQADITDLWACRREASASTTILLTYVVTSAANRVPELRQRIRGGEVVEHDIVHPAISVLGGDDLFGVCPLIYDPSFETFASDAGECIRRAQETPSLDAWAHDPKGTPRRDDVLSITVVPWFAFTGFSITRRPQSDAIPLLAWGKVISERDRDLLPLYVNIHHALVDGIHLARFFAFIEEEARALAESI